MTSSKFDCGWKLDDAAEILFFVDVCVPYRVYTMCFVSVYEGGVETCA